jgi:hypothetical protein
MRSRFQIDSESDHGRSGLGRYDAAPQETAAGAGQSDSIGQFVVEEVSDDLEETASREPAETAPRDQGVSDCELQDMKHESGPQTDDGDWRDEVAARVSRYRERRGSKEPRYPSLRLKFEGHEPSWRSAASKKSSLSALGTAALSLSLERRVTGELESIPAEPSAKIIEFPRSLILPTVTDELAEPILDRPRIMEAPELVPPPPALGGISIEQSVEDPRRQPIEVPLQAASITRRVAAAGVDAAIAGSASALFGYIFLRITVDYSVWRHPNLMIGVLPVLFWFSYQYLFIVHSGRTPGAALTRMTLQTFAGNSTPRTVRRWRVLASLLSALSLGLGYAWCFLDEDQLCWHDRITRTYLVPQRFLAP